MTQADILNAIADQSLPESFIETVNTWYRPIATDIAHIYQQRKRPLIIGIQGCQGSGKSTLSDFLKRLLQSEHALNGVVLSIDDFYLTRSERLLLAEQVHPLLATRGVPGTHDVAMALSTIRSLKNLDKEEQLSIPRFDKARDDRAQQNEWDEATGPIHVILLEGWCVGLHAQDDEVLHVPVNELEEKHDKELIWRRYVNQQLTNAYPPLFCDFDLFVVLKAPSFSCVYQWRLLQETKLIARQRSDNENGEPDHTMTQQSLKNFIAHYQRLTEHALQTLPARADWLLTLQEDHSISDLSNPKEATV